MPTKPKLTENTRIKAGGTLTIGNKEHVLFSALLGLAHEEGVRSIITTILQFGHVDNGNTTIVHSTVTFPPLETGEGPRVFTGIGDAGPHNLGKMVVAAAPRMAETRATGRALRVALNIAETMYEELPSQDTDSSHQSALPVQSFRVTKAAAEAVSTPEFIDENLEGQIRRGLTLLGKEKTLSGEDVTIPKDMPYAEAYDWYQSLREEYGKKSKEKAVQ